MKYSILLLISVFFFGPSASAATLADLQSVVMMEDYKRANELARELARARLSPAEALEARYFLAISFLKLGEYGRAQEEFRRLISAQPPEDVYDKAVVGLIDALYMQGFYDQALKEANTLISKRKNSEMMSLFLLKAARANLKLARWGKAREFLQKIIQQYPESFEGGAARQLLEEKQYFTVQVGSFEDKARAEQVVQELIRRRQYAYIVETRFSDGKPMYRVRVGQLAALKDARELEAQLSGLGYPTLIYP